MGSVRDPWKEACEIHKKASECGERDNERESQSEEEVCTRRGTDYAD